jgi:hypothetical protein
LRAEAGAAQFGGADVYAVADALILGKRFDHCEHGFAIFGAGFAEFDGGRRGGKHCFGGCCRHLLCDSEREVLFFVAIAPPNKGCFRRPEL